MAICEELEGENNCSIGGVLKWYNAAGCFSRLNGLEDICKSSRLAQIPKRKKVGYKM
jgi:hypothetical protein